MVCCACGKKPTSATPPGKDASGTHTQPSDSGMIPDAKRKCTDILCCSIFILFVIGMIVIGGIGLRYGKPARLVYGTDYRGQVCGVDSEVSDSKYTAYPRTNEDFLINIGKKNPLDFKFYGVCVSSCPGLYDVVCNYNIPSNGVYTQTVRIQCMTNSSYVAPAGVNCNSVKDNCWVTAQPTSSMLFRCIPVYNVTNNAGTTCIYPEGVTDPNDPACITVRDSKSGTTERPAKPNYLFDQLNTARQLWGRWFGDLARAGWVILVCAVAFALVLGFLWLLCAKYFTGFIVWTTIILLVIGVGALDAFFYYKAGLLVINVPDSIEAQLNRFESAASGATQRLSYLVPQSFTASEDSYKTAYKVLAFLFTAICIILISMVVALRQSIRIAIAVIKLGSEAMQAIPSMLFFPLSTVAALALFVAWWIYVAASLATAGSAASADLAKDVQAGISYIQNNYQNTSTLPSVLASPTINDTITQIADMPVMNYLLIYHFFGLLWITQFIMGIALMTIAGAVCGWYFSLNESKNAVLEDESKGLMYKQSRVPILSSLGRTMRYHLGSVAFGSFLIALIQFIRAVMAYVQRQLERHQKNNQTIRFIMCCINSCLWCLQKCVQFITRNAFIYIALKGYSFWGAGARVFKLIVTYAWSLAVVNVLSEVIMFLGRVVIAIACAWLAYAILDNYSAFKPGGSSELTSTWLIIAIVLFFAYAVASGFMMVFDISVDSVLVCYVTDIEENNARETAAGLRPSNTPLHVKKDKLDAKAKAEAAEAASGLTTNPTGVSPASYSYVSPAAGVTMNTIAVGGAPPKIV